MKNRYAIMICFIISIVNPVHSMDNVQNTQQNPKISTIDQQMETLKSSNKELAKKIIPFILEKGENLTYPEEMEAFTILDQINDNTLKLKMLKNEKNKLLKLDKEPESVNVVFAVIGVEVNDVKYVLKATSKPTEINDLHQIESHRDAFNRLAEKITQNLKQIKRDYTIDFKIAIPEKSLNIGNYGITIQKLADGDPFHKIIETKIEETEKNTINNKLLSLEAITQYTAQAIGAFHGSTIDSTLRVLDHGDLHWNNIFCKDDPRTKKLTITLIDLDTMAQNIEKYTDIEKDLISFFCQFQHWFKAGGQLGRALNTITSYFGKTIEPGAYQVKNVAEYTSNLYKNLLFGYFDALSCIVPESSVFISQEKNNRIAIVQQVLNKLSGFNDITKFLTLGRFGNTTSAIELNKAFQAYGTELKNRMENNFNNWQLPGQKNKNPSIKTVQDYAQVQSLDDLKQYITIFLNDKTILYNEKFQSMYQAMKPNNQKQILEELKKDQD